MVHGLFDVLFEARQFGLSSTQLLRKKKFPCMINSLSYCLVESLPVQITPNETAYPKLNDS